MNKLKVIKRDLSVVDYSEEKIEKAIYYAIESVYDTEVAGNTDIAVFLAEIYTRIPHTRVSVETIQDVVEDVLLDNDLVQVAKAYIAYRAVKASVRKDTDDAFRVKSEGGYYTRFSKKAMIAEIQHSIGDTKAVDADKVATVVMEDMYDGISYIEYTEVVSEVGRSLINLHPDYSYLAALYFLRGKSEEAIAYMTNFYGKPIGSPFMATLEVGVRSGALAPALLDEDLFDHGRLSKALDNTRNSLFTYLGAKTLYDRYFLKEAGVGRIRYETPQVFFMRVAMGLALAESDPTTSAIEFYTVLSKLDFMSSTPTLFNSGTLHPQMSSCYLTTVDDSVSGVFSNITDTAKLSKFAGGLGNDWTNVRGLGAHIKGTNGHSQGVIPFLKVSNDTALAINQGGK